MKNHLVRSVLLGACVMLVLGAMYQTARARFNVDSVQSGKGLPATAAYAA